MSSTTKDVGDLKIENTNIQTATNVSLDDKQKTLVGSVLDLFAGRPSLAKLQLWADDAIFSDPLTVAKGRKQYEPQWYGLQTAFSEIERLSHEVTSSGNPIEMNLSTRYVVKGLGKEQKIDSKIKIWVDAQGKIERLEDRWNDSLPDGSISNVSLFSPWSWWRYGEAWAFWGWSWVWYTPVWMVRDENSSSRAHLPCCSFVDSWSCSLLTTILYRLSADSTPCLCPIWSECQRMPRRMRRRVTSSGTSEGRGHLYDT